MLHKMSVFSAETILHTLESQTNQTISVADFIKPIPESIEEQEALLQVSTYACITSLYLIPVACQRFVQWMPDVHNYSVLQNLCK